MKVLINASNLHVGGGVQFAVSIIYEISKNTNLLELNFIELVVSSEVEFDLRNIYFPEDIPFKFKVVDTYGIDFLKFKKNIFSGYDLIFNVFGPFYGININSITFTGFAQAWILDYSEDAYKRLSLIDRIKYKLKFNAQNYFFKKSNYLFFELESVRESFLKKNKKIDKKNTFVINNCVSDVYLRSDALLPLRKRNNINLGFLGAAYPHKNIIIMGDVLRFLKEKYGFIVNFYVTFSEQEWSKCPRYFRDDIINIGRIPMADGPDFYKKLDGVVFPTLLECFSVTPIEALVMKRPLFTSDRAFIKEICGEYAFYFDPLSVESIADTIYNYYANDKVDCKYFDRARDYVLSNFNGQKRAKQFLNAIECIKNLEDKNV